VTLFNLFLGILSILSMLLNKILKGDLVIANMVKSFTSYLRELKDKQGGSVLKFKEEIEFYP
jgi:hypothetical protein